MYAEKLKQQSPLLRRIRTLMIAADTTRLHESLKCTGGTSGITADDTLSSWFHEDFSQQSIGYWYRKTKIVVSSSQHLDPGSERSCWR